MLVSAEQAGYYSRPGLAYLLSREIDEKGLFPFTKKEFHKLGTKSVTGQVTQVDAARQEIVFRDQKRLGYDRLLLAVGARAVRPKLEGIGLEGVVYLDSLSSTQKMIQKNRRGKHAVVIGGGITALEIVEGLRSRGAKVHYLMRGEYYWSRVLDETESRIIEQRLAHDGVRINKNTEAARIVGRKGKVNGVITKDGREIKCSLVGVAIGVRPRLEIAQNSGIDTNRGILVDAAMQTNHPHVFAAGDVAEALDPETGERMVDSLWYPARVQGHVAGLNMAGEKVFYKRESPMNVTRLAGITTTIIGMVGSSSEEDDLAIVRGESENWQRVPDAIVYQNNFDVNRVRIMVGGDRLLGALVMGDQTLSRPLEDLVREKVSIHPIRAQLTQQGADVTNQVINFWEAWRHADAG